MKGAEGRRGMSCNCSHENNYTCASCKIDTLTTERDELKAELNRNIDDFTQSYTKLEIERDRLRECLTEAVKWVENELKEIGGCDHLVNICVCSDWEMLERFEAVLAGKEGSDG